MGMLLRRHNIPLTISERDAERHSSSIVLDNSTNKTKEEVVFKTEQPQYTKTDINRMSTAELKEVATNNGIENAEEMTGGDLKKVLIEKFGL